MTMRLATSVGALCLAMATPALADITITDANIAGNPEQNVLLSNDTTGTFIVGLTNQTNTPVLFTGDGEDLTDPPNGQARIEAVDGAFDFLLIALQNPALFFTKVEFNLNADDDGDVTITAIDHLGASFSEVLTLDANGENRINVFSSATQAIRLVRIESSGDIEDISQVRVEGRPGFVGPNPTGNPIPEPATWAMMVLGFGASGALMRHRRRALAL